MKGNLLRIPAVFLIAAFALWLTACDDESGPGSPEITSFTPTSGPPGQTVVLTGKNFSSSPTDNFVVFNGAAEGTIVGGTSTSLSVKVPTNATTGKITVTINGRSATSAQEFVVLGPTITSFIPSHAAPGASVIVNGTNFSTTLSQNVVTINGTAATVEAATPVQLTIKVPEGATTGKIKVTFAGREATSSQDFEVLKDIPRTGLIAFYPFSSNATDKTEVASDGTVSGATLSPDRFGTANHAYSFDGADDVITIGNPSELQISNSITVAAWVNINAFKTGGNRMQAILTKIYFDPNMGGNPTRGYLLAQDFTGGGTATFGAYSYSTAGLVLSNFVGSTINLNEWIHIALTIDDKTWKFYQNGTMTHSSTGSNVLLDDGTVGSLTIGTYGNGFHFDGKIDDVTIYNRALTDAEVQKLVDQNVTKY